MIIEIFKTGVHKDSAGNVKEWTIQDLDTIVEKYNPSEHEAPVVIGHPKDNAPAYGWVKRVFREGEKLYAELKDLAPEFIDWVKRGLYKKRSISLYPDLTLRHVGFLGAMPPAVKGLADVKFSDSEGMTFEFSDYKMSIISRVFRKLRDFIIDKYDLETADRIINDYEIEELHKETEVGAFSENSEQQGGHEMEKVQEYEQKLRETEKTLSEYIERNKEQEEEISRLKKELEQERSKQRKAEFQSFCDELIKEGKLTPAMVSTVIDFMEILHGIELYEFSDGVKERPLEKFKNFLNILPKQVDFNEIATKDRAEGAPQKPKDFKELSGWELIEIYKTDKQRFEELVRQI